MLGNKLHFIGIGGIGMSSLAHIALSKGFVVSGSDQSSSYILDGLRASGAEIFIGHNPETIKSDYTIIYTTGITRENIEYRKAVELRLPILHRSELLAHFMQPKKALLVAGSHGKTTTSSLLSHLLVQIGNDPSFSIGGIPKSLGIHGKWGQGDYFVAEADESDGTFLKYSGYGAIITNIGNDHLNYWRSEKSLQTGFRNFSEQIINKENLFWCSDNEALTSLKLKGVSYGTSPSAKLRLTEFTQDAWKIIFSFTYQSKTYKNVEVPLIGKHNALNSLAVFGFMLNLGFSEDQIRKHLTSFSGVSRRVESKGSINEISIYDDYAHHPSEILATLRALKIAAEKKRLVVVFQPHRYTRTRDCFEEFPTVFHDADELIITDIYSAGEAPIEQVNAQILCEKVSSIRKKPTHYTTATDMLSFLVKFLKPNDMVVTMGAGDITKLGPQLLENLLQKK